MNNNFKGRVYYFFCDNYLKYNNLHICLYSFFLIWLFEWIYLIQYSLNFWSYTRIIFPYRIPMILIFCFLYWCYLWGISVWRRTLHGKFTRGDRKLWSKAFTSFWFTEFSTIIGIYIAACWMSWGPVPLMPRYFLMQKKGFLVELTLFTYIVWLIYLLRLSLKWYLRRVQIVFTSLIIIVVCCLIWRDFITLYSRDVINERFGSKWKYIKLNMIIYSMSSLWWTNYYIGEDLSTFSLFLSMNNLIECNFSKDPFANKLGMTEYQRFHWLSIIYNDDFRDIGFPFLRVLRRHGTLIINSYKTNSDIQAIGYDLFLDSYKFYPRKIGFYPKKIAMWYFLVVLKIWHHFMLFIWWFFYLLRLNTKKKNSYSLLSSCYFNVYCCFIICVMVYCFNQLPVWENFFRIRFYVRERMFHKSIIAGAKDYCTEVLYYKWGKYGSKGLLKLLFYDSSRTFVFNFDNVFKDSLDYTMVDDKIISILISRK